MLNFRYLGSKFLSGRSVYIPSASPAVARGCHCFFAACTYSSVLLPSPSPRGQRQGLYSVASMPYSKHSTGTSPQPSTASSSLPLLRVGCPVPLRADIPRRLGASSFFLDGERNWPRMIASACCYLSFQRAHQIALHVLALSAPSSVGLQGMPVPHSCVHSKVFSEFCLIHREGSWLERAEINLMSRRRPGSNRVPPACKAETLPQSHRVSLLCT